MNFEYIRMLSIDQLNQFITKALSGHLKTNVLVKPTNLKVNSVTQEVEFKAVASNGKYVVGKAVCGNFDCCITIDGKTKTTLTYNYEWADWMYSILKTKGFINQVCVHEVYKDEYNGYRAKVRDDEHTESDEKFEASILR